MRASFRPAVLMAALCGFAAPAGAETHIHLAEMATIMVTPDELAAALRAEASAGTAAEAQKRINDAMRDALAAAKDTPGVVASTGGYGVWRTQQGGAERWQGGQSLNLTSSDGAALLKLTGQLQQKGLIISGLTWRLARETERKAQQQATRQALAALRGRVEEAAAQLDLRFAAFADIRLDSAPRGPIRAMAPMALTSGMAAPPPVAAAEDIAVTASVEADAILLPREK